MYTKVLSKLNNKSILIIGMAREGISTAEFLLSHLENSNVRVTDSKTLDRLDPSWAKLLEKNQNISQIETSQVKNKKFDFVFKTPGIPKKVIKDKYQLKISSEQLISNTQLFFDLINSLEKKPLTIGVTGTKGKSTTSSQIFHILKQGKVNAILGGNIGVPPLKLLENNPHPEKKVYVLEMSSHQLVELTSSPQIAIVQDISPDHLNYYPDFESYLMAKSHICKFQKISDLVIYNSDSKTATKIANLSPGEKIPFSIKENILNEDSNNKKIIELIKNSPTPLVGKHNLYNTIPAVIIAKKLHISDEEIRKAVASFKSVPHRIELIKTINNVNFYNDSAATAPEATIAALQSFEEKPIILITGGSEKNVKFDKLAKTIINSNVKFLVLFPTTGEKILRAIKEIDPKHLLIKNSQFAQDMKEAVKLSQEHSISGNVVLLSPACASFNMFKSYEDRGNQFRDLVNQL